MNETVALMLATIAGIILGAIFFGGLWLTVKRGLKSNYATLWFLVSLLLRSGIVFTGFYLIGNTHWQRLAACLLGFILARLALIKRLRPSMENPVHSAQEPDHAP